jgi:hypothetical protein
MEEEKKVKVTEKEARNKIIQKLRNRKIICLITDKFREDISNENFELEINTSHYYSGWSNEEGDYDKVRDYDKVNISIKTKEYPHIRRALKEFDILKGNYSDLAEKVKFIIQEDIKKKQELKVKIGNQNSNLELLKEKLKGLGARKEYYSDSYIIKNKFFIMTFCAYDDRISVDIEEPADMTIDQAVELIKKLK